MPGRRHRVAVFFFFFRRRRAAAAAVSLLLRAEHPGEQRRFLRPRLHLRDVETVRVVVATVVIRRALADFAVAVVAVDVHGVVVRGVVVHGVVHALFAALRLLLAFAVVTPVGRLLLLAPPRAPRAVDPVHGDARRPRRRRLVQS
eukprot:31109-Pelagococcus_subviridis.AAC.6